MSADRLIVQEVAPRDGLQIEPVWVPTDEKVGLINQLSGAGFSRIEAGSFVSPKAIPALRDGAEVFSRIRRAPGLIYVALIPNLKEPSARWRPAPMSSTWCCPPARPTTAPTWA